MGNFMEQSGLEVFVVVSRFQPSDPPKVKLYLGIGGATFKLFNSSIKFFGAQLFRIRSDVIAVNVDSCVKNTRLSEARLISVMGL